MRVTLVLRLLSWWACRQHTSNGSGKRKGDTHRAPCRYGADCRHKSRCEYRHPSDGGAAVTGHHLLLMCLLVRDSRADAELSENWRLKVDAAVCSAVESLHKFIDKHPTLPLRIIIAGYIVWRNLMPLSTCLTWIGLCRIATL